MIDPVDHRLAARRQPGDHQADRGAQVGGHDLRAFQRLDPAHPGFAALDGDVGPQPGQFRDVHEAVFEDGLADHALALRHRHQRHELGLHIGGEARIGIGLDVHGP